MTATAPPALRIVTFGDLVAGLWGAAWSTPQPAFALGSMEQQLSGSATIDGSDEDGEWRISGEGVELVVSPVGEVVHNATFDGFDQLGRVRGQVALAGAEVPVDVLGRRGARFALELRDAGSVRDVSSFFEPDQGLALTAVRPRKARGHDHDLVAAAVLDVGSEHEVSEPRLSTTYTSDGVPARAGLELWLSDDEDADQYPRRASGEALGAGVATGDADFEVRAEGFRWHSRGTEGSGVYLLMRPR